MITLSDEASLSKSKKNTKTYTLMNCPCFAKDEKENAMNKAIHITERNIHYFC